MSSAQSGIHVQSFSQDSSPSKNALQQSVSYVADSPFKLWCRTRCKPQCKPRRFTSKSALLVIIWNLLINITIGSMDNVGESVVPPDNTVIAIAPPIVWTISAIVFGWLADRYLGHYHAAKIGIVLLFVMSVCQAVLFIINSSLDLSGDLSVGLLAVSESVGFCGAGIVLVTVPQVGLDQMLDSSTSNITSFIAWFVASVFGGYWICDLSFEIGRSCGAKEFPLIWSLFPVVCMGIVLISDFFLTPKWLIIEPKSPKSLKIIYRVLKFAAKHKAPLSRSALTYWEEDIPSRIDLGKSKYGGPFTTEQVEDVKTLLKILALTSPTWLILVSFYMYKYALDMLNVVSYFEVDETLLLNNYNCTSSILTYFTYDWNMWSLLIVVVYELAIYPVVGHITPSSICRIGGAGFLVLNVNLVCLFLSIYNLLGGNIPVAVAYLHSIGIAVLLLILLTASIEFVCAQSPHSMRGLLLGYVWCISTFSHIIAVLFLFQFKYTGYFIVPVVYCTIATLLGVIGFVVFCVLARWYKRRVRDDDIVTPHQWAEDYYDRYLPPKT